MNRTATILSIVYLASVTSSHADTFSNGANAFDIDFVTIGSPGNAPDLSGNPRPAGAVSRTYRIGKYEISRSMIDKANSAGSLGIVLPDNSSFGGNGPNKPAAGITWFDAAKFVNWLNTSTGYQPAYKFVNGDFGLWQVGDAGYNPNNLFRNSLSYYFLPSVDEWYKAAYYDPTTKTYYDYQTGSNTVPDGIDFAGDPNFDAVVNDGSYEGGPRDIFAAGALSPYGTMAQGGNVFEWEETEFLDLINDSVSSERAVRGGSWLWFAGSMQERSPGEPNGSRLDLGFRVASLPEPSTVFSACTVLGLLALGRRPLGKQSRSA
jgi:sulfatase modifying factor 1